jgi:hypothetical protein
MQLAITQNPHTKDPKHLWELIEQEEGVELKPEEFDHVGFELLKMKMSENPRFVVK